MKKIKIAVISLLLVITIVAVFIACGEEEALQTVDEDDTVFRALPGENDQADEDGDDDDELSEARGYEEQDDNFPDDPYSKERPPLIENARWVPEMVTYYPDDNGWYSILVFEVCDVNNDLTNGYIHATKAGQKAPFFTKENLPIYDYLDTSANVQDCYNKAEIAIVVEFNGGPKPPLYNQYFCADIQVTDNLKQKSNKLRNICVYCR